MKTCLIHLSDIHMDSQWDFIGATEHIANIINNTGADKVYIVITGDLASSGQEAEYDRVDEFLNSIREKTDLVDNKLICVPGNHDIRYQENEKRQRSFLNNMTDSDYYDNFTTERIKFGHYISFSSKHNIPSTIEMFDNAKIPYVKVNAGDVFLKFYLLNNAVYTTYKDDNHDDSKGVIFCPNSIIDSIEPESNTLNILLMHFPLSFFTQDTYERIKSKAQYISYILSGHIHAGEKTSMQYKSAMCPVSIGAAIYNEFNEQLGFVTLLIDDKTKTITRTEYVFRDNYKYVTKEDESIDYFRCISGRNPLLKSEKFCDKILYDNYESIALADYFVFPELGGSLKYNKEKYKISSFDKLVNLLAKEQVAIITGYSQSGKTSLINKLFFDFDREGIPVVFDFNSASPLTKDNIKDFIETTIKREYVDNYSFSIFESMPIKERIALVDNAVIDDNIKGQIDLLREYFGQIIIVATESIYSANNASSIANNSLLKKEAVFLSINPMFTNKRYELVEKRLKAKMVNRRTAVDDEEVDSLYHKVQMVLDKYIGTDSNYPYFINKVIDSILKDSINYSDGSQRIYSQIYENYVSSVIMNIFQQGDEYMVAHSILCLLAFKIIHNKVLSISQDEATTAIANYLNDKKIRGVDYIHIIDRLKEKKILFYNGGCYGFCSNDFLSFFAAKEFSDVINNDFENNKEMLNMFLEQCHVGVVARFLLFLSSLSNKNISLYFIDKAEEFVNSFKEIDIINKEYALKDVEFTELKPLTRKEKVRVREKVHDCESQTYVRSEQRYENEVNAGKEVIDDDTIKLYYKGVGFLELISSMIPDMKTRFDYEHQKRCINIIYSLPLIVLDLYNMPFDGKFDELASEIKRYYYDKTGNNLTNELTRKIIVDHYRSDFLAIVDYSFSRAHTILTSADLCDKEFAISNTRKIMRLMPMMLDNNAESTFEKVARDYFNFFTFSPFARNCISLMVRYYLSWLVPESDILKKKEFAKIFFKDDSVFKDATLEVFAKQDDL